MAQTLAINKNQSIDIIAPDEACACACTHAGAVWCA